MLTILSMSTRGECLMIQVGTKLEFGEGDRSALSRRDGVEGSAEQSSLATMAAEFAARDLRIMGLPAYGAKNGLLGPGEPMGKRLL